MRRCRLLVATALLLASPVLAQAGSVRGVVHDQDFDVPLAGARVTVVETGRNTTTTDQGNYVLGDLPPGRYTLEFRKDGYVAQLKSDVVVAAGRLTEVDARLSGDFTDMPEFVVQDVLELGGSTEQGLLELRFESPSLLDSVGADLMSRAGASSAEDALRLVPGASVQDKAAVIRGLPDRYVSSQMNGVRLPTADEDKRAVELDQFPAVVIESVRVSKTFTPDQQGDASGGAVDVRLKGIPDEPWFFKVAGQVSHNSQVTGRGRFLTYDGGGVSFWGRDDGRRAIQTGNLGGNWDGAAGVREGEAPLDYKLSWAAGGSSEVADGVRIGGFASLFYERDSSFFDNGRDDSWWVETPGDPLTPRTSQGSPLSGDFKTSLYDVTQASQLVQWGGLATFGVATEDHRIDLVWLYTHTAEDTATLAEDTRGKAHFFPGHDPDDPTTPGHDQPDAAPYLRLETLDYTERTATSLQLHGRHRLPGRLLGTFTAPQLDWFVAHSTADQVQPDKRQFGSFWLPGRTVGTFVIPPRHFGFKPAANFTLGNFQRIWKDIEETSDQYATNLTLPFEQWTCTEGYLKVGWFDDRVVRTFDQETFSNFGDNSSFEGPFEQFWSASFPYEDHPITGSLNDVDYRGKQRVSALYAMVDLPLLDSLDLIGGARFEKTRISIVNDAEQEATWFPPGSLTQTALQPGDADVAFGQEDVLPAVGLQFRPLDEWTLRVSYSETVARQTFKELTPILQQEYLGGPIFIGNPELEMSSLENWDVRLDFTPEEGTLLSASWFHKDIDGPIEYVQRVASFDFTTAVNYPRGELSGIELEARQDLGRLWDPLAGLSFGANATLIDSEVILPADEAAGFEQPNILAPMTSRDMTNAPEHLYNLYLTWELPDTGTRFGLFYTVQGDTLVAGAGQADGRFVPSVYATEFDTLNLTVAQRLGEHVSLQFQAKNLTDPRIEEVYRSEYVGADVTKTSFTRGVEYSIGLGGEFRF